MSKQKSQVRKGSSSKKPVRVVAAPEVPKPAAPAKVAGRGPGRPRVTDPRVSTHLQLTRDQRKLCGQAATHEGLSFAAWSRMVLLHKAREVLSLGQGLDPAVSSTTANHT